MNNKTPNPVDIEAGHNLRQIRTSRGLTQENLGEAALAALEALAA